MVIENTNIEIREGAYFLEYCPSGTSNGKRVTIMTHDAKTTAKKYKKAGYYLFGTPVFFSEGVFFKMTKLFKFSTKNKRKIVIGNAMYHIQNSADKGKLQTENL